MVNSIYTGIGARDKHLLEAEYFDAINYTKIILESSKIEQNTNGDLILFAALSIKGIKKNQYEIIPGIATRMATRADKLFPSIGRAVVDFKISRVYKGPGNKNH
jgi:hypothetical protein